MYENAEEPSEFKSVEACAEIKTAEGEDKGLVEHLITVFGVMDMGRDVSHPGSFTKTIDERESQIRVVDSHNRKSTTGVVGKPVKIWEVGRADLPQSVQDKYPEATGGVKALTQFLMDTPEGRGVFLRIKAGAVSEFSYGYDEMDSDFTKGDDGKQVRNLRTVRLWEYGPVVFGLNRATEVQDVKSVPESDPKSEPILTYEEAKALSYTQAIKEVRSAFSMAYNDQQGPSRYWVKEVFDEFLVVEDSAEDYSYYQVDYEKAAEAISFKPRGEWLAGKYEFVAMSKSEPAADQGEVVKALEVEIELIQIAQVLD